MVTKRDYEKGQVEAAFKVLLEVTHILGEYKNKIVLIGGWIPYFLCQTQEEQHIGSTDIDLALDYDKLREKGYKTIRKLLLDKDYKQDDPQSFEFYKNIIIDGNTHTVQVHFFSGEYSGKKTGQRTQRIQDINVLKSKGVDLVFESPLEIKIEGTLPNGAHDQVNIRIANIIPFIIMKSFAIYDRWKEKDASDIYYCIRNYPGGIENIIELFKPYLNNGIIKKGLKKLAEHFESINDLGPVEIANFEEINDPEEKERIRRDAFERVRFLLEKLGIE